MGFYKKLKDTFASIVSIANSDVQLPVDIQNRYSETRQTQNAVSIPANGNNISAWQDSQGFDKVAVTLLNDALSSTRVIVHFSNDGVTKHGGATVIPTGNTEKERAGIVDTQARYFRVAIDNLDTASAHTMSAWVYLKS